MASGSAPGTPAPGSAPASGSLVSMVSLDTVLTRALEGAMPCLAETIAAAVGQPPREALSAEAITKGFRIGF